MKSDIIPFRKNILYNFEKLRKKRYENKKVDISKTIFIAGSPRSGTTWLFNILSLMPKYCTIFEPFHNYWFPECREIGFTNHVYIPPNDISIERKKYVEKLLHGRVCSKFPRLKKSIYQHPIGFTKEIFHRIFSENVIIKSIRANRFLPWMITNFPECKYIFIIRHPCAVISSQIESGITGYFPPEKWKINKEIVLEQAKQILSIKKNNNLLNKIKTIETKEEILALVWCLDTYIPLKYINFKKYHLIIYEKCVKNGEIELKKIFNYLDKNIPKMANYGLSEPSFTSYNKSYVGSIKQLKKWKKKLSKDQIESILKIVNWFDLKFYSENEEPDYTLLNKEIIIKNG
jgi:hypothetical protein